MKAVKTRNSNHNFGPPPGLEDYVIDLPCQTMSSMDAYGYGKGSVIFSVWEPTDEERKAISEGANVRLGVGWTGTFPPVSIGITDEERIEDDDEA